MVSARRERLKYRTTRSLDFASRLRLENRLESHRSYFFLNEIPLSILLASLFVLLVLSAFFSGAETALMTLNRYRLLHQVKNGHPAAMRAQQLLQRPDRLIGFILLGNNFVNILASSLTTVVSLRIFGGVFAHRTQFARIEAIDALRVAPRATGRNAEARDAEATRRRSHTRFRESRGERGSVHRRRGLERLRPGDVLGRMGWDRRCRVDDGRTRGRHCPGARITRAAA